jgi:hypothetical protein
MDSIAKETGETAQTTEMAADDTPRSGVFHKMSSSASSTEALRFWRSKKDSSQDFSLQERETPSSDEQNPDIEIGTSTEYRTYKRRWFGLAQLTLMNIMVSWGVSQVSLHTYRDTDS